MAHAELRTEIDKQNSHSASQELREFQQDIGALIPWHRLWAETLLGRVTKTSLDDALSKVRDASASAAQSYYREDGHTANGVALLWLDILHRLDAADKSRVSAFAQWKSGLKRPLFTSTLTALARLCGQNTATRPAAIEFALEAFNITKDERSDAENTSEGHIAAARSVLSVSVADARAYFNEAVEVASKIGDENLSRWDALLNLADRAAHVDRPSPEAAYQFARCAELTYDYVARDKHFDWTATIEALCGLCPSSSVAILSRWRDRDFGWSQRILPTAIEYLVSCGSLSARDAPALIGYHAQWSHGKLLDNALAACTTRKEKEAVADHLYRYVKFDGADQAEFQKVVTQNGLFVAGLQELVTFKEKTRAIEKGKRTEQDQVYKTAETSSKPPRNWDHVFAGHDLASPDGLAQSYAAFKQTEAPWSRDQFFNEAMHRVPVGSEVAFIEAIGTISEFELYHFRDFLEQVPERWKGRPAIAHAVAATLKDFCRRYCLEITRNRYYEVMPWALACELAGASEVEVVDVVLNAIGEIPDLVDANRLFSLVGLLTLKLSQDEALAALTFGLDLFTPVLEDKDGDGPWSKALLPPVDIKMSVAGYIWASLAAPEGVVRWEGSHAVLGLIILGRQEVLQYLMRFASEKTSTPFVDARLPFYSLHALQWLLIGVARGAIENPAILAPYASQLVDWALKDQSHVLVRQFAAQAALTLMDQGVLSDGGDLRARLTCVNVSPLPIIPSKLGERLRLRRKSASVASEDDRYYFGLDIGPYWYAPLGRVFALGEEEIEAEALKVIRAEFGYMAKGRWDEDERGKRNIYREGQAYHSHGSHPRADTLHFYHAYHAMMIVAGRLLASTPTHLTSEFDDDDKFSDWLERHDLTRRDGRWLWDRRDPTPLERPAWQDRTKDDEARRVATTEDFDEALYAGDMVNVWGHWTAADYDREQSVSVLSALVSSDRSQALLRALGTAKSVQDYAIPSADSDMEINQSGFALKGWIVDRYQSRGLDAQDRWAGGISFPAPRPARSIIDLMELTGDFDLRVWKDREKSVVMVSQVWGHYDEGERNGSSNPELGSRIQASLKFLTALLTKVGRDLIIEVKISRNRRYHSYERGVEDDKERMPTKAKLYLLGADGRIRTL